MGRPTKYRPLLLLIALTLALVLVAAVLYVFGMTYLEHQPRSFWQALEWAAETLSTTGYGADSRWTHPAMVLFVVLVQLTGIFLVVLGFPLYLIPALEERFQTRLPTTTPPLSNHLIVYRHGPAVAGLVTRAIERGVPVLVVEEDAAEARRLLGRPGLQLLFGKLEDGILTATHLHRARAVLANGSDDQNAALILEARQLGFAGEIVALVEEPYHRQPILVAGASAAFTPRHILGAALAARASEKIGPTIAGIPALGRQLRVAEVRIHPQSELAGRPLASTDIGARLGVHAIGLWLGGELRSARADLILSANGILVAVGREEGLERLATLCGQSLLRRDGPFVVAGYGEVGRKVVELLRDAGEPVRTLDRVAGPGVDIVGDLLDHRVLQELDVAHARAVILALDSDTATLFAAVILREQAPEVPILARVNREDNVARIHRAGADFALAIGAVSGQMLAHRLLGEEALSVAPRLTLLEVGSTGLIGRPLGELRVRERTGCSIVAVERGEQLIVEIGPLFAVAPGDRVYVCGDHPATRKFKAIF